MHSKIEIIGHLGRDPEMRYTPQGQATTSFSVATTRKYTASNGEQVKETTWFRVTVWGNQAEACNKFLKTGSLVLVEGRLVPDKATGGPRVYTKKDGTSAAQFEINASSVIFLSSPRDGAVEVAQELGGVASPFDGEPVDQLDF